MVGSKKTKATSCEDTATSCSPLTATIGDSEYSRAASDIIGLCAQLRALGVSGDIKLPTLVTAGNQSSGKSSVVEGIAGIPLPRSCGTCTRCPTEVRLRRAAAGEDSSWSCSIKLKREYDAEGHLLAEIPPEELFCTITQKQQVTMYVAAAQAALLNPRTSPQDFLPVNPGAHPTPSEAFLDLNDRDDELEFTANSVVLDIRGADVDLAIIDLPGIIQSHPKGHDYVDMIKDMVTRNIEQEHVVIVMTLTAMDDLENQAINLIARESDPGGQRMIGVITKPDNIPDGEQHKWVQLAKNERAGQELSLGYFVVKNPGQKQLDDGLSCHDARQHEAHFFSSNPYWSKAVPEIGQRLGTHRLRDALSSLLLRRIRQELPLIRQHAEQKLKEINSKLKELPQQPADLEQEFHALLGRLAQQLSDAVRGQADGSSRETYQSINFHFQAFRQEIKACMPVFEVKDTRISMYEVQQEDGEQQVWTLDDVRRLRARHLGPELPSFSPYSAVVELISEFKGRWSEAVESCLCGVEKQLQAAVEDGLQLLAHFPAIVPVLRRAMATNLEEVTVACRERLQHLTAMEGNDIFTGNEEGFIQAKDEFLSRLKMAQSQIKNWEDHCRAAERYASQSTVLSNLSAYGMTFRSLKEVFLAQATPADSELHMMAATLAYFQVSYLRFMDQVPLHIRNDLLNAFADKEELPRSIARHVKAGHLGMQELLAEDSGVQERRKQLRDQKARLTQALALLQQHAASGVVHMPPPGTATGAGPS